MLLFGKVFLRGRYFGGLSLTTALVSGLIAFPGYAQDATWNNPANGSYSFYGNWNTGSAPVSNDTATFSGTPSSTVTLDAASVTVGNVVVNDIGAIKNGTFDFNSGSASTLTYSDTDSTALASSLTLNLNGADLTVTATENMDFAGAIKNTGAAATLSLDTTAVMTLSGVISDATAVTVGSGAVTLSGTNTYTGATTVSAGTLNIGSAAALGASTSVTVNTPGTLDLNGFDTTAAGLSGDGTITNDNGGAGNAVLTVSGAAFSGSVQDGTSDTLGLTLDNALETDVFALSGTNSYSGDTTIETGILVISGGSAIHDDGLVTVTADSTLRVDASEDVGLLSGAGSVDLNGAGVTLTLGDTGGGAQTHSGVISGAGNLAMAGGGTQTLSGANTYTGATTVTAGTLVLNNAGGMALADSTAVTVTGTLDVQSSETIGTLAGAGTVDVNSNTLTLAGAGDTTFSGTLAGAGTLAKIGGDTLTLSGDNTAYTGGFTISGTSTIAGGANAGGANAFGTGAGAIALDNGTLNVTATSTVANAITVAAAGGAITTDNDVTATLTGAITATGGLTFGNGTDTSVFALDNTGLSTAAAATTIASDSTVVLGSTQSAGLFSNGLALNGTLDLNGNNTAVSAVTGAGTIHSNNAANTTLTINGPGSFGALVADGSGGTVAVVADGGGGTLSLSNSQTYTGGTTVNNGTLSLGTGNALADTGAVTVNSGGTLALATGNETIGALGGAGNVTLGANTLTVTGAETTSFGGVASGTGGLTLNSTGQLTLTGANDYTGATTVTAGTLVLNNAGGMALADSTAVTVDGTLDVQSSETIGTLAGAGTVDVNSNTLTLAGAGDTTFSGTLAGAGGFTKTGAGILTLSGNNDAYTGATTISAGTVIAQGGQALGNASAVTVDGTLNVQSSETIGTLAGAGTVDVNSNTLTLAGAGDTTFSGTLAGAGTLAKIGGDTLTLSGDNTAYTGGFTISGTSTIAGGANAGGANAFGTGAGAIALDNGTLNVTATSTVANAITVAAAGGTVAATTGTVTTLTGDITRNGTMTFGDGTVGGGGQVIVNSTNFTGTGSTTVASNLELVLGSSQSSALLDNGIVVNGILDLNGKNPIMSNLTGTGVVTSNAADATFTFNGTAAFNGSFVNGTTGVVSLDVATGAPANVVTLTSGSSTYSGATTITSGTLQVLGGGAIGDASAVTVNAGTVFDVDASETVGSITGTGSITVADTHVLTSAQTDLAAAPLATTYDGVISGMGGLTVGTPTGTGTLTLTNVNTYTGPTTVDGGTLFLGNANTLADTGAVVVNGTLDLMTTDETIGALAGASTGVVNISGNTLNIAGTGNGTTTDFDGVIAGAGGQLVVNNGTDTLRLGGANTFTGGTTVNGGTLATSGSGSLGDVTLNAGAFNSAGTVSGTATIAGGTMTVTGGSVATANNNNGVLSITGGSVGTVNSASNTSNSGTVTTAVVTAGTFTNQGGGSVGTATVSGGSFSTSGSVTGSLTNNGASVSVGGGSVASLNNNSGTATITGGSVASMSNSATASNAGSVGNLSQSSGTFTNAGNVSTANISGGSFSTSGTVGTLNNSGGTSEVQGGTVTVADNTSGVLNITGGSVGTLTSAASTTNAGEVVDAEITGGTFENAGTVSGTTTISAGDVTNSAAMAGVSLTGGTLTNLDGTLGSVTNAGGTVDINGGAAGVIVNEVGTLAIAAAGETGAVTNSATATNLGTVESLSNLAGTFDNGGTITGPTTVIGGTVSNTGAMGDVAATGGTFTSSAGSIGDITIDGGAVELTGGTVGAVANQSGTLTLGVDAGAVTNSATLFLTGSATSLINSGGASTVSGRVSGPTTLTGGTLTNTGVLNGGIIVSDGTLVSTGTIVGPLDALGGTTSVSGRLDGALLAGDGGVTVTGNLTGVDSITNDGAGALEIAAGTTTLDDGGLVTNTGTLTVEGALAASGGTLSNTGTIRVGETGSVALAITNDGNLQSDGNITGDVTNNAGRSATIGGTMTGNIANAAEGEVTLAGTQTGAIENRGEVTVTGTNIGGVINYDQLTVVDGGTVDGDIFNAAVLDLNGEVTGNVTNNGSASSSELRLRVGDGAVINLNGRVAGNLANASDLNLRGRVDGMLTNAGQTTLQEGVSRVEDFVNDTQFTAEIGTLTYGTFSNNGVANIRNAGILSGGAFANAGELNIGNGGRVAAGTLVNDATLRLSGDGVIGANVTNNATLTAVGTNQVGGDLTNAASGEILMQNGSTADVITVTGDAELNGRVTADMNLSPEGQGVDQINVTGRLSGNVQVDFTDMSEEFGTLDGGMTVLSYGSLDDGFTYDQTGLPAGRALIYGFQNDPDRKALVIQSGANPAVAGIASGLTLTQSLINTVVNRPSSPFVAGLAAEDDDPCGFGSWARGVGGVADATGQTSTSIGNFESELSASYGGLQVGFDYSCFDSRYAGFDLSFGGIIGANAGSLSQPVFKFDPNTISLDRSQQVSVNDTDFNQTYAGAYIGASRGRLFGDIQLRFDQTSFDLKNTAFVESAANGGLDDLGVADQEYDSTSTTISGSVGYAFPLSEASGLVFVPAVGVSHSRTSVDNLRFDGGTPGIAGDDGILMIDDIVSTVGFVSATLSRSKVLPSGTAALNMFGTVTYYHDFGDDTTSRYFALDANGLPEGEPLTTTSSNLGAYAEVSLGVNYTKLLQPGAPGGARQFDASLRIDGRFSGGLDSYGITGQMRFQF